MMNALHESVSKRDTGGVATSAGISAKNKGSESHQIISIKEISNVRDNIPAGRSHAHGTISRPFRFSTATYIAVFRHDTRFARIGREAMMRPTRSDGKTQNERVDRISQLPFQYHVSEVRINICYNEQTVTYREERAHETLADDYVVVKR